MTTYVLEGFNTDSRYPDDVRHRQYTTSKIKADAFERIPKIQFTDSGHGVVFQARVHTGPRKPVVRMDYVEEQLALQKASPHVLRHIGDIERQRLWERKDWQKRMLAAAWMLAESGRHVSCNHNGWPVVIANDMGWGRKSQLM